jgi:AbrB family looped-hinge helix DNA binding protein
MDTVVISPGYEIRLPERVRDALGWAPGQRLRVVQYAGRVELAPYRPAFECPGLFGQVAENGDSPHFERSRQGARGGAER